MADFDFDRYPRRLARMPGRTSERPPVLLITCALVGGVIACITLSSETPLRFINIEGLLIVLGGTLAATLIQFSILDMRGAFQAIRVAAGEVTSTPHERMSHLLDLSRRVKERGVLVLEDEVEGLTDDFLKLGLMLVVDSRPLEDIRRILTTEMESSRNRLLRSAQVWETMGNFAPAMGLIGTLLGLIQLLGALHDPTTVGPAMSMALVATLYGSIASNLCFFPFAGKLRLLLQEREESKRISLEGILSLASLENPTMLQQRLQSFASAASEG